jgi:hypothetical protein
VVLVLVLVLLVVIVVVVVVVVVICWSLKTNSKIRLVISSSYRLLAVQDLQVKLKYETVWAKRY